MQKTKHNKDFWLMSVQDMNAMNFLRLLNRTIYDMMLEFLSNRIIFNPQHVHDIMNKNDHIYNFLSLNVQHPIDFNDMKNEDHVHGNDPIS